MEFTLIDVDLGLEADSDVFTYDDVNNILEVNSFLKDEDIIREYNFELTASVKHFYTEYTHSFSLTIYDSCKEFDIEEKVTVIQSIYNIRSG